jgi:hypothetical protein
VLAAYNNSVVSLSLTLLLSSPGPATRGRCIPKKVPGADWRELRELVRREPEREKFKVRVGARGRGG